MGGPGSGPKPAKIGTMKGTKRLQGCVPYAWRVIKATLVSAARQLEKPPEVAEEDWRPPMLPPNVIALAQWCAEQEIGKPTVKVDQNTTLNVALDPSRLLAAVREAEARGAAFLAMPEHQLPSPERDLSHVISNDPSDCAQDGSPNSHSATLGNQVVEVEYRLVPEQPGSGMPQVKE